MKKFLIPALLVISILFVVGMGISRRIDQKGGVDLADLPTAAPTSQRDIDDQTTGMPQAGKTIEPTMTPTPTIEPVREITLSVTTPANNSTVQSSRLTVRGNTVPRAEVFINEYETRADSNGNFTYSLTLDEGENIIIVVANDEEGNLAEAELIINFEP